MLILFTLYAKTKSIKVETFAINKKKSSGSKPTSGQSIFRILLALFPPYLIAIILFPSIVGFFLNFELVDFDTAFLIISYAAILMFLRYLSGRNIFYYFAAILVFVNGSIMLTHWLMLKGPMTATSLFVVFNTNYNEAVSFFRLKNNATFFLLIPYVVLFILSMRFTFKIPRKKSLTYSVILGLVVLIVISFIGIRVKTSGLRAGTPLLVKSSFLFYEEISAFQALKQNRQKRVESIRAVAPELDEPQIFLLIQGESANRNHLSLYGYYRDTSPYLSRFDSLILFDDVVSGYTMTLESLSAELTEANLENGKEAYESYSLMDVFRAAGFKTYWLSNQSPLGIWDNVVTLLAQQSDVTTFVNVSGNSSLDSFTSISYDGKLFAPFRAALTDTASRKFIVVHLMGSHGTYAKRYPPEFNTFHGRSEKEEIIATYDNSILYTDFVVDSLLKILRHYSNETDAVSAALYLSDHGENVYDDADYAGHDYTVSAPKSIVEIPFMVWLSRGYKNEYPEKSSTIHAHRTAPFVSDDLFHTFLDLTAIHSSVVEVQRSLFSPHYNKKRKRILSDGKDYDKK